MQDTDAGQNAEIVHYLREEDKRTFVVTTVVEDGITAVSGANYDASYLHFLC